MASLLYRLGQAAHRHWVAFMAAWLLVFAGLGATAAAVSQPLQDGFTIPGIPSLQAQDLQQELFPGATRSATAATVTVAVQAPPGQTLSDPANSAAVDELIGDIRTLPQMPPADQLTGLVNPVQAAAGQREQMLAAAQQQGMPTAMAEANAAAVSPLSADGTIGTMTWNFAVDSPGNVEQSTRDAVTSMIEKHSQASGLTIEAGGTGFLDMPQMGLTSELIGVAIAALVLLLTFGSLIAAGLPIVIAGVSVGVAMLVITAATALTEIATTTPMLATMIGLAVGIDYTLFILSRYRSELEATGGDRVEAIGRAVGTAGSAVVFAGLTVLIALSALSIVGISFLTAMGLAAAFAVFTAVLAALTLLPAVLGALKGRVFRQGRHEAPADPRRVNGGVRWATTIARRPIVFVLAAVALLGMLAVPAKDLHLALPSDSTASSDTTQRRAADLISEGFGPGREAPFLIVVDAREAATDIPDPAAAAQARQQAFGQVMQWAAAKQDVANAQVIAVNQTGDGATILLTPATGAQDEATTDLLTNLREDVGGIESRTSTTIGITGHTAVQTDVSDKLADALPLYLGVVVGLAFLLLMLVFRSVLVPLTATLGFLLSILATLGLTVLVFQKGSLGLFEAAPLVSFMPIILIGIVFGLAMDYQVFLVSRMREMYTHGETAREAIVDGFRHGARVVTAAAVIMIAVFAAFIVQPNTLIASMGFALAAAIVLDAFVVRMTLIPAVMNLIGDRAWWLPRWLDRVLPKVDIEGEKLTHRREALPETSAEPDDAALAAEDESRLSPLSRS